MYNQSLAFIISKRHARNYNIRYEMGGNAAPISLVDGYFQMSIVQVSNASRR